MTGRNVNKLVSALTLFAAWLAWPLGTQAAEMTFQTVQMSPNSVCGNRCVQIIVAEGEITGDTAERFLSFASAGTNQLRNVVFLDSPGGNVVGSLRFGKVLRSLGTTVVVARVLPAPYGAPTAMVAARCMSACVYAFMGGSKRVVPPQSKLGIHRMFRKEENYDYDAQAASVRYVYAPDEMVAALSQYSGSMGISPALVARAETISPQSVHIVTRGELHRWHLGSSKF